MEKIHILATLLFLLLSFSCQKDEPFNKPLESLTSLDTNDPGGSASNRGNKVDVCHNGKIINVSVNAIPTHQGHGDAVDMDGDSYFDLENVCSPGIDCNDSDPNVNPGLVEIPGNSIDDDCDPSTVEELVVYIDLDGLTETGDEYSLYVHPDDNSSGLEWGNLSVTEATT
ncbi:MAG: hypothetical protein ACI8P3_002297 [Saprospiraceae bacterium]|jgi:hypothetical protein